MNNIYNIANPSFNVKKNTLKISRNNTLEHELAKFLLMWEHPQNGNDVYSEMIFKNGKRVDIFVPNLGAFEVLHLCSSRSNNFILSIWSMKEDFEDWDETDFWWADAYMD